MVRTIQTTRIHLWRRTLRFLKKRGGGLPIDATHISRNHVGRTFPGSFPTNTYLGKIISSTEWAVYRSVMTGSVYSCNPKMNLYHDTALFVPQLRGCYVASRTSQRRVTLRNALLTALSSEKFVPLYQNTRCQMEEINFQSVTADFRGEVAENCPFLGYYAASSGNFLSTFRDNLSVPSSGSWGWDNFQSSFLTRR